MHVELRSRAGSASSSTRRIGADLARRVPGRSGRGAAWSSGSALGSRAAVDERYADLIDAGYAGRQPPFDAFWGARYAIVADPDGNDVGLMSPIDDARRTWPPTESPDP